METQNKVQSKRKINAIKEPKDQLKITHTL